MSAAIDGQDLVDGDIVRFKSFDGLPIPNIFYRPHRAAPDRKAPALVWVHGGPGGQTRKGYSAPIQYLVNHGYVVLGINNRGSSGYGKSPLFHADRIRRPLLVLQGQNDPRVIKPESDEIVEAVKKNGVPVEYVVFPDEGHGFAKKKNEIRAWSTTLDFLDKHLGARAVN